MNKILVVNMNYLGDALMTTPVHAALRSAYPNARIDAIAGSQSGYGGADVLAGNPDIDHLIKRKPGGFWPRCWQLLMQLLRVRYDAVIVLPPIWAYNVTAILSLTRIRIINRRPPPNKHMVDTMLSAIRPLVKNSSAPREMVLIISDASRRSAASLLPQTSAPLIGINLGASRPQKRWPSEHYAALIDEQRRAGRTVVLLGGDNDDDHAMLEALDKEMSSNVLNLVGKTDVGELAAVIERCNVIVTADTGAMHMAAALKTPVVALFGSTDPVVTGPYGPGASRVLYKRLECSPCNSHPTCDGKFMCMRDITVDEVAFAVNDLLNVTRGIAIGDKVKA